MFSTTRAVFGGLISAAVFVLLAGPAQAQTTLKYKFKEGDKLNYTTETTQKNTLDIMGNEVETSASQNMDISWRVAAVKQGKAEIVQTIGRIRMKMDSPFGNLDYDSKDGKEAEGPIGMIVGPVLSAMSGAEFTVTMTEQGDITNTKLSEAFSEAVKSNPLLQQLGGAFTEDGMKNMISQQGGSVLSKEAVTKGDTWNQKTELKVPPFGVMKISNTYTYQGPEDRDGTEVEKIDVKTEITIEAIADPAAQFEFKVKSSEAKGTIYFDNKAGRIVTSIMNTKMAMEISAMGNVFDMVQNQAITMKLVTEPSSGE